MKPKDLIDKAKDKAAETWRNPENKQRVYDMAGSVGDAAVDSVLDRYTKVKRNGERKVKKTRIIRDVARPIHTLRKVAQDTAGAARQRAKDELYDTAKEHVFGSKHEIPVRGTSHSEEVPVRIADADTPPWDDDGLPPPLTTPGRNEDTPPWDEPIDRRNHSEDNTPPPWNDELPPAI
jgi:hypothetical protein